MKRRAWKGRFIVFEGIDGSGTTTQATLAAAAPAQISAARLDTPVRAK